ncbi:MULTISPECIES: DUF3349 domain-containing protein [unclassified Rathayibacter]|jgi:hypothetical protein|uniref:DUF3349 domain-containing protein n=1 Tax=unclassified Rathayibacter TaxID=2609250 RepID=UPI000CE74310|nr:MULTISPECIES: DUF3349 domain-containing protein [unclassified Rathayibacter]PPF25183.1 hypothetical protein C5C54_15425 [Rathayibacter sp. AY1F2]PPG36948.1 hypothetical protein C5C30_14905 [Rathayibacter sp. AY2B5]PPH05161.1 hypothetical protein C5C33_12185 [Rathayibacter sp. AY1H3]PPH41331.1 hypothetical protein C5C42_16725 [Rathayibacter sp. AY1F7]PPH98587.1 hypothetical protein C5C56_10650 [Rathayibacter sp. AY1D1]
MASTDPIAAREGIVARVVGWLRAGYPSGVPEQDYLPLLGLLRRSLTTDEVEQVVARLLSESERAETVVSRAVVRERIEQLLLGPAMPEDVARVSSRLAKAGWPLAGPESLAEPDTREGLVTRIVRWLRAGYPAGLPEQDFVPLLALLRRRLSDEEVAEVAAGLAADAPASRADVGTAIAGVTSELPSEEDIERVRRSLAALGWPEEFAS